jgi:RNA polymerase sigma factor (sigma-70 family)
VSRERSAAAIALLYHHCRLQLPRVVLELGKFQEHLRRMEARAQAAMPALTRERFLAGLYPTDAYVAMGCLENQAGAWERLFAARVGREDRLFVDALRQRAARFFPRDVERQETAVNDFWGHLLLAPTGAGLAILARFDGVRPLVPWLIRVFTNRIISQLRSPNERRESLADNDLLAEAHGDLETPPAPMWHESFREAARTWLAALPNADLLVLGLRWRYRLSQREVAQVMSVHEGTISRQLTHLRDAALNHIEKHLADAGWTGDDLQPYVLREMESIFMDEPRLSATALARLLQQSGKRLPGAAARRS